MSYFIAYQYEVPSYLEYPFLVAQDVCLIAAAMYFGAQISGMLVFGYSGILTSLVAAMIGGMLSDPIMALLVVRNYI